MINGSNLELNHGIIGNAASLFDGQRLLQGDDRTLVFPQFHLSSADLLQKGSYFAFIIVIIGKETYLESLLISLQRFLEQSLVK